MLKTILYIYFLHFVLTENSNFDESFSMGKSVYRSKILLLPTDGLLNGPMGTGPGAREARGALGQSLCMKWLFQFFDTLILKPQSTNKSCKMLTSNPKETIKTSKMTTNNWKMASNRHLMTKTGLKRCQRDKKKVTTKTRKMTKNRQKMSASIMIAWGSYQLLEGWEAF